MQSQHGAFASYGNYSTQRLMSELWLQIEPFVHDWFKEWAPTSALVGTNLLTTLLLRKVAHVAQMHHQIWPNYQCAEHIMPNYLQSIAQQGEYLYLMDAIEQIQNLRQSECKKIENVIKDTDQLILPEKTTNPPIVSGAVTKRVPVSTCTLSPNTGACHRYSSTDKQHRDSRDECERSKKRYCDHCSTHYMHHKYSRHWPSPSPPHPQIKVTVNCGYIPRSVVDNHC
uniref:Uncharacterized protein n=1 Tax=Romanomermis culicivorax TaxID=13658 RepID=A0A915L1N0_ROMCU